MESNPPGQSTRALIGSSPLAVSPLATRLLELATRRATGQLTFGGRGVVLQSGDVADILPGSGDESLEQFLVKTGRVPSAAGAHPETLLARGSLNAIDLRQVRRALLLDRLTRALRAAAEHEEPPPEFRAQDGRGAAANGSVPLLPLLLDGLSRWAQEQDAAVVGAHLNHRLDWVDGPYTETARVWADLGDAARPAVSTVLAKRPAAAPRIAALLRAGLLRLDAPGAPLPSDRPREVDVPPRPTLVPSLVAPPPEAPAPRPSSKAPPNRAPRLRLDPGQGELTARPIEPVPLPDIPDATIELDDPLVSLERRLADIEGRTDAGRERARLFAVMAGLWRERFYSIERACRAYREAAAADPNLSGVLEHAALHCHQLGQRELAQRYADAAVSAASIAIERASVQRLRAAIARSFADLDGCIEALCEAAADDPTSPEAHEQVALLLHARGQLDGANAHARLAATAVSDEQPERALLLLAFAYALKPEDAPTAYEYASQLDAAGRRMAAVAVLAHAASAHGDREQQRKLRLSAAERAEAGGRPDLAAELLLEAFDAEPGFDLLYGPLDEDLGAIELVEYRAVVLEDIATAAPDEQRAYWLGRAAQALLAADGQHEAAVWLLFEALLTDPRDSARLQALREHCTAPRELILLAHGLRAAIAARLRDARDVPAQLEAHRLLDELGALASERLGNPHLAVAAYEQLLRVSESTPELERKLAALNAAIDAQQEELGRASALLARASAAERPAACLRMAQLLPDLPEHWPRKIELYSEALAGPAEAAAARDALETLHGASRDAIALATFLEDQAERTTDRQDRVRLLSRLAAVHTVREDVAAISAASESLLAIAPDCAIAIARLERAARKTGDARRLATALERRAAIASSARGRARAFAQLARNAERTGAMAQAAQHAADALREDASAADAALLLVRHGDELEPGAARSGLQAAFEALGPSRDLFEALAQNAAARGDAAGQQAALQQWLAHLPGDALARQAQLALLAAGSDADALLRAAEEALATTASRELLGAVAGAFERLEARGAYAHAARLALRMLEGQGTDGELCERALACARKSGEPELSVRALEQRIAGAPQHAREPHLFELARVHRSRGDAAAEARALLRVLELQPDQGAALSRLRELFRAAGDGERLLLVLARMIEAEPDPDLRRDLRLEACAASSRLLGDRVRAEREVSALCLESGDEPARMREALGLLFSLGDSTWALERAQGLAQRCPPALGSRVLAWCAATASERLQDDRLALEIARAGALRYPAEAELLLMVERITLQHDDATTALATYDGLIAVAVGPHGRRALLYRSARWLERAGIADEALARYLRAFEQEPTRGATFKAIERLARVCARLECLVPCYERLAQEARDARVRFELLRAAGQLCVDELEQVRRAFDLLRRANAESERFELDAQLLDLARLMRELDAADGETALRELAADLAQRATELFNAEDRVGCLDRLASLLADDLHERSAAAARLDEALATCAQEGLPDELAADLVRRRDALQPAPVLPPPELVATDEPLRELQPVRARATPPLPKMAASVPEPEPEPVSVPEPVSEPKPEPDLEPEPEPERARASSFAKTPPTNLRARLIGQLVEAPHRIDLVRELAGMCTVMNWPAERHVTRQWLSLFDPSVTPAADPAFHSALYRGGALQRALQDGVRDEADQFLAALWEFARVIPRFRKSLGDHGVTERERISRITVGPVAEAYAQAARTLSATHVPVYVSASPNPRARALPTNPPAVLAGRGVAAGHSALLYWLAHALWLADPRRIIAGVLAPEAATELLDAAKLAFAPASARRSPSAATKELAAALWQNTPSRTQRQFAETVGRLAEELDYPALRARVRSQAACAALLTSGNLRAALVALPELEPELENVPLDSEARFTVAAQRSPALSATLRTAVSEPFLTALQTVLGRSG